MLVCGLCGWLSSKGRITEKEEAANNENLLIKIHNFQLKVLVLSLQVFASSGLCLLVLVPSLSYEMIVPYFLLLGYQLHNVSKVIFSRKVQASLLLIATHCGELNEFGTSILSFWHEIPSPNSAKFNCP